MFFPICSRFSSCPFLPALPFFLLLLRRVFRVFSRRHRIPFGRFSIPLFVFQVYVYRNGYDNHQRPGQQVAVFPAEFGHPLEVHAPDAGHEGQGDEDGGDDGELLHDAVHALVVVRKIEVDEGREQVAAAFEGLQDKLQVVVHVVEEGAVGFVQQQVVVVEELVDLLLQREDALFDEPVVAAIVLYVLDGGQLGGGGGEKLLLHVLQFVLHL